MKLYMAGPDVFRPDLQAWMDEVRDMCKRHGHEALIPFNPELKTAPDIFRHNLSLIKESDAVIANLNPFRGAEPDSGTCVEVGYALALGKRVVGYLDTVDPLHIRLLGEGPDSEGRYVDQAGWVLENFELPLNLMLAVPVELVQGGLLEGLTALET